MAKVSATPLIGLTAALSSSALTEQLASLQAQVAQAITTLFHKALQRRAATYVTGLELHQNAGTVGINCIGGLDEVQGVLLATFRRSQDGTPLAQLDVPIQLNILRQLEQGSYAL